MSPNDENLANVAKWLDLLDDTDRFGLQWLLLPQGRDAIERRLIEMGYNIICRLYQSDKRWGVELWNSPEVYAAAGDAPAEALIATVAELAKEPPHA
jgi:hypothetical protein